MEKRIDMIRRKDMTRPATNDGDILRRMKIISAGIANFLLYEVRLANDVDSVFEASALDSAPNMCSDLLENCCRIGLLLNGFTL